MLRELESVCAQRTYAAGAEIVGYLDDSDEVYFVLSGRAKINIYSSAGKVVGFRALEPGDIFGEFAAIDRGPRSASIEAERDCVVGVLPAEIFRQAFANDPDVAQALAVHLVTQLRALTVRIFEFSTLAVNNRIQAELLRLAREATAASDSEAAVIRIDNAPTHSEIAARISTHREAVTRQLNELSRMGIIERQGRAILIKDFDRLLRMVNEATGE